MSEVKLPAYMHCNICHIVWDGDYLGRDACPKCGTNHVYAGPEEDGLPPAERTVFDVAEIDDLLDSGVPEDQFYGKALIWHDGLSHRLVRLSDHRLAMQLELRCARCKKHRTTVYTASGLHSGAWCYAYDRRGKYIANLRDQEYICPACERLEEREKAGE